MGVTGKIAAACAASALLLGSMPAAAQDPGSALKLRQLDIMLMVTALRCRFGADGFQADYDRFSSEHAALMNDAARSLQSDLAQRLGEPGAVRELDRISVRMANEYGQGHPWLDCAGLKQQTEQLVGDSEPELVAAADTLLAAEPPLVPAQLAQR